MKDVLHLQFYSEAESSRIPTAPGLYAFYLRPLTPSAFGLLQREAPNPDRAHQIRRRIAATAKRFIGLNRRAIAEGVVTDSSKASHVAMRLNARLEIAPDLQRIESLADAIPDVEIRDVLALLGRISLFSQPVYVGLTYDNTLAGRYEQHHQDHLAEPSSLATFGGRLRAAGFEWRHVVFGCMPTSGLAVSAKSLEFLEKYFQALSSPSLTIR